MMEAHPKLNELVKAAGSEPTEGNPCYKDSAGKIMAKFDGAIIQLFEGTVEFYLTHKGEAMLRTVAEVKPGQSIELSGIEFITGMAAV